MRGLALLALVTTLAACGGSSGDDPDVLNLILPGDPSLDGAVTSTGLAFPSTAPIAGDTSQDLVFRGVVAFDIRTIPAGASIRSATLRLHQDAAPGTPYVTYGPVIVDHFRVGPTLDGGDFTGSNEQAAIGQLWTDETLGYHDLDVTSRLEEDIADGRDASAFRLRLIGDSAPDDDGGDDAVLMTDAENSRGTGNPPQLVVRYVLP